tara:strand:- start:365 stop:808 length:444 start_codon:yes stop_codon:yes gene_type:complete
MCIKKRQQMPTQYQQQQNVDLARQKNDLMYHILVNTEATTLDDVCQSIVDNVHNSYKEKSVRLKNMLRKANQSDDRVAKHALIFFALYQEPSTNAFFLNANAPRVPPQKFTSFVQTELPPLIEKLMNGAYTSLRAFVEDARWTYVTL